jgi:hypothetical protein
MQSAGQKGGGMVVEYGGMLWNGGGIMVECG